MKDLMKQFKELGKEHRETKTGVLRINYKRIRDIDA